MKTVRDAHIVLDLETSGIEHEHGFILEIAAMALDENLDEIGTFHSYVDQGYDIEEESLYEQGAWELHQESGLIDDMSLLESIPNQWVVQDEFREWATDFPGDEHRKDQDGNVWPRILVGNNVESFDLRWLNEHMPRITDMFHYRPINVSSLRRVASLAIGVDQRELKEAIGFGDHRAMDDVRCCVAELRHYRDMMTYGSKKLMGMLVQMQAKRDILGGPKPISGIKLEAV